MSSGRRGGHAAGEAVLHSATDTEAWRFVVDGGSFTFGGESHRSGARSALKVLLVYARLVDEISLRRIGALTATAYDW